MDNLMTGVFMLFVLPLPVSCTDFFWTEPVICYFLDGFLIFYCLLATAMFFKTKYSSVPAAVVEKEDKGCIYQELERPKDADPYQILEPKRKEKAGKKKKAKSTQPEEKENDPSPPLMSSEVTPGSGDGTAQRSPDD